eukprot:4656829-Alexandrium_andersonii.AAC.1
MLPLSRLGGSHASAAAAGVLAVGAGGRAIRLLFPLLALVAAPLDAAGLAFVAVHALLLDVD